MIKLPSVEELSRMAVEEPEKLEALQLAMNNQLIESAPEHLRLRMEGLLWKITAERRRHTNPLARCMAVSKLMMESLVELNVILNGAPNNSRVPEETETAKILEFPSRGEDK